MSLILSTRSNAQKITDNLPKITPIQVQLFDCKKAYIKLSDERDTLKAMLADSLLRHRFERTFWVANTKKQVKTAKKSGRKQGITLGVLGTLGIEVLAGIYFLTR